MVRRGTRGAWGRGPRPVCCGRACRTKPARRGCEDEYIGAARTNGQKWRGCELRRRWGLASAAVPRRQSGERDEEDERRQASIL